MAEPEDLLDKADALMARHRPLRPAAEPLAEIPVLHEVVHIGDRDTLPVLTELAAVAALDQGQSNALAPGLSASLLAELELAIDQSIETRLKERLEPLVERMFNDLRAELQSIARRILNEAISKAVEQELERRKSSG